MKEQYVGDISDYIKYSVLRSIQLRHPRPLLVCWMLTAADRRSDGRKLSYLSNPARYRGADPELFDTLHELTRSEQRTTAAVEASGVLGTARFVRRLLADSVESREEFMADLLTHITPQDVVFFDPDNGLGVASTPPGRPGSGRYVYDDDLRPLREFAASVVIYQHFPRVPRGPYVAKQLERLSHCLPGYSTFAVHSTHVAFLAAVPDSDARAIEAGLRLAVAQWKGALTFAP